MSGHLSVLHKLQYQPLGMRLRKGCDFSVEISVCGCGMRDLHCPGHSLLRSLPLSLVHPEFTNAGATRGSSTVSGGASGFRRRDGIASLLEASNPELGWS